MDFKVGDELVWDSGGSHHDEVTRARARYGEGPFIVCDFHPCDFDPDYNGIYVTLNDRNGQPVQRGGNQALFETYLFKHA